VAARNHIELVEKTMRLLEVMAERPQGMPLREIAARVGLVKSSTFRILFTLRELGYADKSENDGAYRLTLKIAGLTQRSSFRPTLVGVAKPHMNRLRDELWESVWLGEWRRDGCVLIGVEEATHQLQLSFKLGDSAPLHATAIGKAIGAHLAPEELEAALGKTRLERFTRRTIVSRTALRAEYEKVRKLGYAVNDEETIDGAILIATPIADSAGKVFAALSVSAPTVRCSAEKRKLMIAGLKRAASAITKELEIARFRFEEPSRSGAIAVKQT
jgi:DNA-binding IclR family transcriptional regulator